MKNKVRDILADKKVKLQELTAQAEAIDDTVAEIDKYSAELACTRQALSKNRTHNTALIANFAKLLEVPETESQPVA